MANAIEQQQHRQTTTMTEIAHVASPWSQLSEKVEQQCEHVSSWFAYSALTMHVWQLRAVE